MERYIHKITDADDSETTESKLDHNAALINNTELHIIHGGIKHELDKEKLKKLQEEYDPSSEFTLKYIGTDTVILMKKLKIKMTKSSKIYMRIWPILH